MLKSQLARALELPKDQPAERAVVLLKNLEAPEDEASDSDEPPSAKDDAHACDRVIAALRAKLAAR